MQVKTGLKIHFIYEGKEMIETIYGAEGDSSAWFNFRCLYPDAHVIGYAPVYKQLGGVK